MLWKLLALFVMVPLIELVLLLRLSEITSVTTTILIVIATGVAGTVLARSQGWKTFRRIQIESSEGRIPGTALLDAAMIFVAGALLLTPGLLTDLFGMSLLVPVCRRWYRQWLMQWIRRNFRMVNDFGANPEAQRSKVIDSHVVDAPDVDVQSKGDRHQSDTDK